MGYILLEGGAEFSGQMAQADSRAMGLAGGKKAQISIIPAAAAPDNNHEKAGMKGENWFRGLGARNVQMLPLIDGVSANDPAISKELRRSKLIFLLGGFPGYLADTLKDSLAWKSLTEAEQKGGIIAGSSAGAMVLCQFYYDPIQENIKAGLNLIANACVLPHHNAYGSKWIQYVKKRLPHAVLIGIDEETGMIVDTREDLWHVYGKGAVTLYRAGRKARFTMSSSSKDRGFKL